MGMDGVFISSDSNMFKHDFIKIFHDVPKPGVSNTTGPENTQNQALFHAAGGHQS